MHARALTESGPAKLFNGYVLILHQRSTDFGLNAV